MQFWYEFEFLLRAFDAWRKQKKQCRIEMMSGLDTKVAQVQVTEQGPHQWSLFHGCPQQCRQTHSLPAWTLQCEHNTGSQKDFLKGISGDLLPRGRLETLTALSQGISMHMFSRDSVITESTDKWLLPDSISCCCLFSLGCSCALPLCCRKLIADGLYVNDYIN